MLVTNEYGNVKVKQKKLSGRGQLYDVASYPGRVLPFIQVFKLKALHVNDIMIVLRSITPSNGSINGGTVVTLNGQYFSNDTNSPLEVNIGDKICKVLKFNSTDITCQLSRSSLTNRTHFSGNLIFLILSTMILCFVYRWSGLVYDKRKSIL